MRTAIAMLALVAISVPARSAEPADAQVAQLLLEVAALRAEVKRLDEQVARLTKALDGTAKTLSTTTPAATRPSAGPKATSQASRWETSFQTADRNNGQLPELGTLAIGSAGRLPGGWITVVQILGESEMIARFRTREGRTFTSPSGDTTKVPEAWEKAIFTGVDTSTMVDGRSFGLGGQFIVAATRRIRTADGASFTYFVIEPLDEKAWKEAYDQHRKAAAAKSVGKEGR